MPGPRMFNRSRGPQPGRRWPCNAKLHDEEEPQAQAVIREAGGEIVELSSEARTAFMDAVQPLYAEARSRYPAELLEMVGF